jgi:lysozyme
VKASGRKFAIARVSDGTTVIDPKFTANWQGMKAAGLVRGVYQFFRPNQDPVAQADILLNALAKGGSEDTDLPAVLDVETAGGVSNAAVRAAMKTWLDRVEQKTGRKPIIYTAAFMSSVIGTGWTAYPLWVANYETTCPTMPSDWSKWKFWQYSSTVSVPGITGNVDANHWNGTLQELIDWAKGPPPAPPPAADGGAPPSEPPIGAAPGPGTSEPPPAAAAPPPLDPCGG